MIAFLDSSALIYQFEGAEPYRVAITTVLRAIKAESPNAAVIVSRLAVMECRVKPLRDRNVALLAQYESFFKQIQIVELSATVVDVATTLRASIGLKTPDALHAASALSLAGDCTFITGDTDFANVPRLNVRYVRVEPS